MFTIKRKIQSQNWVLLISFLTTLNCYAQERNYFEKGRIGDTESWHSTAFNNSWALAAINADRAYAAGYSGKGIKIGIFDNGLYKNHPIFSGTDKVTYLTTSGIRQYTDPYIPVKEGDKFYYDGSLRFDYWHYVIPTYKNLITHGTSVASLAAGSRNGSPMQGTAYNAQIISADNGDPGPEDSIVRGNDGGVYRAGWDALIASGVRVINNSWNIGLPYPYNGMNNDPSKPHFGADAARKQFEQIAAILNTPAGGAYQGAIDSAHSGIITVFAAGNEGGTNAPDALAALPWFIPDLAPEWLTVVNVMQSATGGYEFNYNSSNRCGYSASFCVAAPGTDVKVAYVKGDDPENPVSDYMDSTGTSLSAPVVSGSAAVLMERFPYMTGAQIVSVLRTTATDMGAPGIDKIYGWGMINLGKAIRGPAMLVTEEDIPQEFRIEGAYGDSQFTVNMPGVGAVLDAGTPRQRLCDSALCAFDIWDNDISGHGGLTKTGSGTLLLTGNSSYRGPTLIDQGQLVVNGKITSDVTVNKGGLLSGSGHTGALKIAGGGTVAPGSNATLTVDKNVTFAAGSRYAVGVNAEGESSRLHSNGTTQINGGEVLVSLGNSTNLLSQGNMLSLLGRQYKILSSAQGVNGKFSGVRPNYLFIGSSLQYQPESVTLLLDRNATTFASVAKNNNQRAAAEAAERLGKGNPLFESLLMSTTAAEAARAFQQLGGQIHADIAAALVNESRYLRDALDSRLRQSQGLADATDIHSNDDGAWVQLVGAWDHASGGAGASGFQSSTWGVLLGSDKAYSASGRLGIATGYTRTSLDGGMGSHASSDNYHLALYGDQQFDALVFRAGAGMTWHRIDTARSLSYGNQSAREKAKYGARTQQLFAETGYGIEAAQLKLEPFANLAYINFGGNSIAEGDSTAAVHGDRQHSDALISTLGMRAEQAWQLGRETQLKLNGELGWEHQYASSGRAVGLKFNGGDTAFNTHSVSASRNGMVVKTGVNLLVSTRSMLSLGYAGTLSPHYQDNRVNAAFNWSF